MKDKPMNTQKLADKLSLTPDQIKASLEAIPTWIAIDLLEHDLEELIVSITNHSILVYRSGYSAGLKDNESKETKNV